jgi:hypothetical protein
MHPFLKDASLCPGFCFVNIWIINFWNFSDPIVEVNAVYVTSVSRGSLYEKFGNKCVKILTFWRTELSYAQDPRLTEVTYTALTSTIGSEKFQKFIIQMFGTFLTLSLKLMQWYVTSVSRGYLNTNDPQGMQFGRFKNRTPARFEYIYCTLFPLCHSN